MNRAEREEVDELAHAKRREVFARNTAALQAVAENPPNLPARQVGRGCLWLVFGLLLPWSLATCGFAIGFGWRP